MADLTTNDYLVIVVGIGVAVIATIAVWFAASSYTPAAVPSFQAVQNVLENEETIGWVDRHGQTRTITVHRRVKADGQ